MWDAMWREKGADGPMGEACDFAGREGRYITVVKSIGPAWRYQGRWESG